MSRDKGLPIGPLGNHRGRSSCGFSIGGPKGIMAPFHLGSVYLLSLSAVSLSLRFVGVFRSSSFASSTQHIMDLREESEFQNSSVRDKVFGLSFFLSKIWVFTHEESGCLISLPMKPIESRKSSFSSWVGNQVILSKGIEYSPRLWRAGSGFYPEKL